MKPRTYGRSKRTRTAFKFASTLDCSSPEVLKSETERHVLSEISENIRPNRPKTTNNKLGSVSKSPRCHDYEAEKPRKHESKALASDRQEQPYPELPSVHEDLIVAIEKLCVQDIKRTSPVVKAVKIQQQPASITEDTSSYLKPLIDCRNVSKCIENFQKWADQRASFDICKVGEGSFGEVYRAQSSDTVILKLVPLNASKGKGSRSYTSVTSAVNEITLLEKMQKIPGFVEFRGACVLQGAMASQFVSFWNSYKDLGRTVESKDPNKKGTYPESQLWLLIEMSDAGRSLEPGQYLPPSTARPIKGEPYISILRTWDIWWQTVRALAKAEVLYGFEHRDLHGGNLCLIDLEPERDLTPIELSAHESQSSFGVCKSGIQVTLIDYSLSRAAFSDGREFFYDFQKDKKLLSGTGDLQYDMYRHMAAIFGTQSCKNFEPKTNIVWLYFVLKLLLRLTLRMEQLVKVKTEVLTVGEKMLQILNDLEMSIDPKNWQAWKMNSAGDLIELGIRESWFVQEDVVGD